MKKIIGNILIVISIIAGPLAFYVGCLVGEVDIFGMAGMSYLWISFLFLPLTIGCLIFGCIKTKSTNRSKKHIVIGICTSVFIAIMGISGLSVKVDKSDNFVKEVSVKANISLPSNLKVMTKYYENETECNFKILDSTEEKRFQNSVEKDPWVTLLPAASKGLLSTSILNKIYGFDFCCLFVETTNSYNPQYVDSGNYSLILFSYQKNKHHVMIISTFVSI